MWLLVSDVHLSFINIGKLSGLLSRKRLAADTQCGAWAFIFYDSGLGGVIKGAIKVYLLEIGTEAESFPRPYFPKSSQREHILDI